MLYRMLADLVVLIHLTFIVFVLCGGLLALRWRWMPWLHVPAASWGVLVAFFGWSCPLTPLENELRRAGGSVGYAGSFVDRYIAPVIYPTDLTRDHQVLLAMIALASNLTVYFAVRRRWRNSNPQSSVFQESRRMKGANANAPATLLAVSRMRRRIWSSAFQFPTARGPTAATIPEKPEIPFDRRAQGRFPRHALFRLTLESSGGWRRRAGRQADECGPSIAVLQAEAIRHSRHRSMNSWNSGL